MSEREQPWAFSEQLAQAVYDLFTTGKVILPQPGSEPVEVTLSWGTEMDRLTRDLEQRGMYIWLTAEVDGCEYRLAAPGPRCNRCLGPSPQTVGLVCQACGTDYIQDERRRW